MAAFFRLILILGLVIALPPGDGPARLFLQNVPLQDDRLLVVNLQLAGVTDLYAADIQLGYNPAQLRVRDDNDRLDGVQITPGPLLAFDDRFVAVNQAETGLIRFVFTLLRPAPPITGEGVLATVVFEIIGPGPYEVAINQAQLASAASVEMPATLEGLQMVVESGPTANVPATLPHWVSWAGIGLLLALVGLGVWAVRRRPPATATADTPATVRVQPNAGRAAAQSAALLTRQGHQLLQQDNPQAAYELFSQAIELDPANAEAWLGKGLVARHPTERHICFERALTLNPALKQRMKDEGEG